ASRRIRYAPNTASAVLPAAMPVAAVSGTAVAALARSAPKKTAGQYRGPSTRSAASARPVGGQTGEMDSPIAAYRRPTRATTKYAAASTTASIYVSDDGGDSWTLRNTLPSQAMTADITHAVGGNPPVLYAGIMKVPGFPLNELKTSDFLSVATMTLQSSRPDIDQPFVRTT